MRNWQSRYEYPAGNPRLAKSVKMMMKIGQLIYDNPGLHYSELRRIAVAKGSDHICSIKTFDKYARLLRENKLVTVDKQKNKDCYYATDLSILEQVQDITPKLQDDLLAFAKELDKAVMDMKEYYHTLEMEDPEKKAKIAIQPIHDCLKCINRILFLSPVLQDKELKQFSAIEASFRLLLQKAIQMILSDPDAYIVYPSILAALMEEMKPLFKMAEK